MHLNSDENKSNQKSTAYYGGVHHKYHPAQNGERYGILNLWRGWNGADITSWWLEIGPI